MEAFSCLLKSKPKSFAHWVHCEADTSPGFTSCTHKQRQPLRGTLSLHCVQVIIVTSGIRLALDPVCKGFRLRQKQPTINRRRRFWIYLRACPPTSKMAKAVLALARARTCTQSAGHLAHDISMPDRWLFQAVLGRPSGAKWGRNRFQPYQNVAVWLWICGADFRNCFLFLSACVF